MRPYELVVLMHPDLEIDIDTPIAKVEKLIEQAGGKVTRRDNWGKKRLAYKIRKHDFAVYVYFEINFRPDKVRDFENTILITDEVIRHMLVAHVDVPKSEPKAESEDKSKSGKEESNGKEL